MVNKITVPDAFVDVRDLIGAAGIVGDDLEQQRKRKPEGENTGRIGSVNPGDNHQKRERCKCIDGGSHHIPKKILFCIIHFPFSFPARFSVWKPAGSDP